MKKNKLKFLFKSKKIGKVFFKNKIISSPISINMAKDGLVTKNIIDFFSNLAKSGVGMVTVGATAISKQGNDTLKGMMSGKKIYFNGLKLLSNSIKKNGSVSSIQLYHVGSQGNPIHSNHETVGPSEYHFKKIGVRSRALKIEEIIRIEKEFSDAIIQCYKSNFDFIELHLAHGYLLHEFLSGYFNKRRDNYGITFKNRFKIIKNILEQVYQLEPRLKGRIGFRLSANDYVKTGFNLRTVKQLVKNLDKFNPAYYVITAGLYETAKNKYQDMKLGKYWEYAKEIKKITKTNIIAQGGLTNLYLAEDLIKNNCADFVGFAQSLIADPNLIKKTIRGEEEKIIPCIAHLKVGSCHRCRYLKQKDNTFSCITPTSWKPSADIVSKKNIKKDLLIWEKINKEVYGKYKK
jgi:2,4-dienoyl-CoA reductase-like NADH-dependent reductase (Old Yellow Enzyme family)